MIQIILMLLGLAFGQNNANTSGNNNSNDNGQSTTQLADPGTGTNPGDGVDPDGPEAVDQLEETQDNYLHLLQIHKFI